MGKIYPNSADEAEAVFHALHGKMSKASRSCPYRVNRPTVDHCEESGRECLFELWFDAKCETLEAILEEWRKETKSPRKETVHGCAK